MGKGKWQTAVMMAICLVSSRSAAAEQNPNLTATPVSMIQLIATPERFDNKQVSVIGFLNLEFEGDALWPSKGDYDANVIRNAIRFDVPSTLSADKRKQVNGRYVIVVAKFKANEHGHMELFAGTLTDIVRVDAWRSRDETQRMLHPEQKQ